MSELPPSCSKSFHGIETDYAFFENSINEREATLEQWGPTLKELGQRSGELKVLDFGAGTGSFTADILDFLGDQTRLHLTLVEPAESSFQAARERFQGTPLSSLRLAKDLAEVADGEFDLILSHHVMYYVPELAKVLVRLRSLLASQGHILIVVGGEDNGAGMLQNQVLDEAGITTPYRAGVEVRDLFFEAFPEGECSSFYTRLKMEDVPENRASIMRFLVGEFGTRINWQFALSCFDPYTNGTLIRVPSEELFLRYRA